MRGQQLVVEAGQHHQRHAGGRSVSPPNCLKPLGIGQSQIQQDNVDLTRCKMLLGFAHTLHMRQIRAARFVLMEHFAQQTGVSVVIFHHQNDPDRFLTHALCLCRGNLALVSQKSLMLFTRLSNASNCTGLLR